MLERMDAPDEVKVASKKGRGGGIKALITCGDLSSVVCAAKKWQAHVVENGGDASKLLHHIANAEAVLTKFTRRNKLAFERRVKRREAEAAETFVAPTIPNQEAAAQTDAGKPFATLGKIIDMALGKKAEKPAAPKSDADAKRPSRW